MGKEMRVFMPKSGKSAMQVLKKNRLSMYEVNKIIDNSISIFATPYSMYAQNTSMICVACDLFVAMLDMKTPLNYRHFYGSQMTITNPRQSSKRTTVLENVSEFYISE